MDIHSYLVITFHIHAYMYVHYTLHTHTHRERESVCSLLAPDCYRQRLVSYCRSCANDDGQHCIVSLSREVKGRGNVPVFRRM